MMICFDLFCFDLFCFDLFRPVPEGGYGEEEDCINAEDEEYRAVLERMEKDGNDFLRRIIQNDTDKLYIIHSQIAERS